MYQKKIPRDIRCPLEYGLEIFGGKWKSRIICALAEEQKLRYGELQREMVNITDAVLSTTLKELVADGLVLRKQCDETSPRAEYALTEKGESVVPVLRSICVWAGTYYHAESDNALSRCKNCKYRCGKNVST